MYFFRSVAALSILFNNRRMENMTFVLFKTSQLISILRMAIYIHSLEVMICFMMFTVPFYFYKGYEGYCLNRIAQIIHIENMHRILEHQFFKESRME